MTKTLYLLRHAKSDQPTGRAALKDHERTLAPRGIEAAKRMSQYMTTEQMTVGRVYCSTAKRTRETFDHIRNDLKNPAVSFRDGLYLAASDDLIAFIQSIPDTLESAMIIGHNPGFHDTALALMGRASSGQAKMLDKLRVKFPTCGLCALSFNVASWKKIDTGLGTLTAFVRPKDLAKDD